MESSLYAQIHEVEGHHWWYVGRRRIVLEWIRSHGTPASCRVLDIGCGTGFNVEQLRAAGFERIVGLDVASEALGFARSRGLRRLVRGDGARLPFLDQSFDLVLALDLLEHIEDDTSAISEIVRLLAPGGQLIVFTPAFRFLWSLQDEVSHHYRRYTARELRSKLQEAGLIIDKLTYANTFLFPVVVLGRAALRFTGKRGKVSENELHPRWANGALASLFSTEASLLKHVNLPFGVSLLSVATRR